MRVKLSIALVSMFRRFDRQHLAISGLSCPPPDLALSPLDKRLDPPCSITTSLLIERLARPPTPSFLRVFDNRAHCSRVHLFPSHWLLCKCHLDFIASIKSSLAVS